MELTVLQIIILIAAGASVGISMSFIGQTGSGIVIPIVYLITGDVLLAIAINIFNDLIAATVVSIFYIKNKNYYFTKDNWYLVLISVLTSIGCVCLLFVTNLSKSYGILLPVLFIVLGIGILKRGFPTAESIKQMVHNITERYFKGKKSEEEIKEFEEKIDEKLIEGNEIIEGVIPHGTTLHQVSIIIVGIILGGNSGLFGAAGGFIIAVVLILYGYSLKKAVGSALIISIFICLSTFLIYQVAGQLFNARYYFDWTITFYLALGAVIMGFIMSLFVQNLSAKAMGRGMGVIMVFLGISALMVYFLG